MTKENKPTWKEIWKNKIVTIKVPYCTKCNYEMEEETNPDAKTMWHWICRKCNHKY